MAQDLFYAHRYDEAIEVSQKGVQLDPNFWLVHDVLGLAYLQKGRFREGIEELKKARELVSDAIAEPAASLGYAYAVSGDRAKAKGLIAELENKLKQSLVSSFLIAEVYAALGEKDEAFRRLEKAYEEKSFYLLFLPLSPLFDNLRPDPRFHELIQKLGQPKEAATGK
jgi:tetratricopeptide (TPR) repeat protein